MRTKKALAIVLAALTLLGVAGTALAAPKAVALGSGISVGGVTVTGGSSSSESGSQTPAAVQTGTIVNCSSWVSMRKTASSSSPRVAKLNKGVTVTILGTSGTYYKVSYNNQEGYVSAQYVQLSSTGSSTNTNTNTNTAAIGTGVTTGNINFRTGPATSYSKVSGCSKVPKGAAVEILATSGSWYQVRYKGYTGYLSSEYVRVNSGSNTNSNGSSSLSPVGGNTTGSSTVGANRYATYTGTASDRWGTMQVAGTNISTYIYCNAIDKKGNFYYNEYSSKSGKNYVYAMSYYDDPIAVITGHNMRVSRTGLHELHHVQNAWLGKSKCDYTKRCSANCSNSKTSTFDINYNGASKWQLVCFYEIDKSTVSSASARKKIMYLNCFNSTVTGELKQQWLDSQFMYATSAYRGMKVANASSSDKLMLLMTCADSSGDSYQRLYMVLKAIG